MMSPTPVLIVYCFFNNKPDVPPVYIEKGVKTIYMFILPQKLAEEMETDKRRTKNSPYPFNKTIPQRASKNSPFLRQKP